MITRPIGIEETHYTTNVESGVRIPHWVRSFNKEGNELSKSFTLDIVLTVTSGILLTPIDELYRILNYLTGEQLYTHQLPRASEFAKPHIFKKYPELKKVEIPNVSTFEEVEAFINSLKNNGMLAEYELEPMTDFVAKNPIQELIEMRGSSEGIIPVVID